MIFDSQIAELDINEIARLISDCDKKIDLLEDLISDLVPQVAKIANEVFGIKPSAMNYERSMYEEEIKEDPMLVFRLDEANAHKETIGELLAIKSSALMRLSELHAQLEQDL